jgi:putative MATE family efflux protein
MESEIIFNTCLIFIICLNNMFLLKINLFHTKKEKRIIKMENEALFKEKPVWTAIFSLSIPSVIAILVMILYNVADMFFVGQMGDTAQVAAVSVVGPLFSLAGAVGTMLGGGGCALIAKSIGSGNLEKAKAYASHCFWGACILGLAITLFVFALRGPLLALLGVTDDIYAYAIEYLLIANAGVPLMLISMTMSTITRAEGAIKEGLIGNLTGTLVNLILDPVFIVGLGLGVRGAAIATVLGNLVGTLYFIVFLVKKASVLTLDIRPALHDFTGIFHIIAMGIPNAISSILSGVASGFSNNLLGFYGTNALAAMGAAGKVQMISAMLSLGICMGIQPLLAYNYGAQASGRLREILRKIILLVCSVGTVAAMSALFARHTLIGMFLKDASAVALGEEIVIYLMISAPVIGLYYLATNFLQAAGKAFLATVISVLRQGFLLIASLFLFHALLGLQGIYLAYTAADLLSVVLATALIAWQVKKLR